MKQFQKWALALAVSGGLAVGAQASVLVTTLGDLDNFGIGAVIGDPIDLSFIGPPDGDGTDEILTDPTDFTLSTHYTGPITAGRLYILGAGWGANGAADVLLNGHKIGALTNTQDVIADINISALTQIDLTADQLASLTGDYTVRIVPQTDGTVFDAGAVDYLQLQLTIDDGSNNVPEPGSFGLAALALLAAARRVPRRATPR